MFKSTLAHLLHVKNAMSGMCCFSTRTGLLVRLTLSSYQLFKILLYMADVYGRCLTSWLLLPVWCTNIMQTDYISALFIYIASMFWWRPPSLNLYKWDILILKMSSHSAMYSYVEDGVLYHGRGMIKILQDLSKVSKENMNIFLHLGCWFPLFQLAKIYPSIAAWFYTQHAMKESGDIYIPFHTEKHVKWGQACTKNQINQGQTRKQWSIHNTYHAGS